MTIETELPAVKVKALESEQQESLIMADELFNVIKDAYIRGATWYRQNDDFGSMLHKAAYDYADKTTGELPKAVDNGEETRRLREALQNVMGVYDTPLSRRRFPPDNFMNEALASARSALTLKDDPGNGGDGEAERLREALKEAERALKPLADAVFNDNGDMTVSLPSPTSEECIAAYFVERRIAAAIRALIPRERK